MCSLASSPHPSVCGLSAHALISQENLGKMSGVRISSITKRYSTPSQLVGKAGIKSKEEQTGAIRSVKGV